MYKLYLNLNVPIGNIIYFENYSKRNSKLKKKKKNIMNPYTINPPICVSNTNTQFPLYIHYTEVVYHCIVWVKQKIQRHHLHINRSIFILNETNLLIQYKHAHIFTNFIYKWFLQEKIYRNVKPPTPNTLLMLSICITEI